MIEQVFVFSAIAAIGFGIADMWSSIPAKRLPAKQIVFYESLITFIIYGAILFFGQHELPKITIEIALLTLLTGASLVFALRGIFESLAVGKVGVVAPIFNADALVAVVIGAIVFKEVLSLGSYLSILLILVGIFLLSANLKSWANVRISEPGVRWALVAMISFGVGYAGYKALSTELTVIQTLVLTNLSAVIITLLIAKNVKQYFAFKATNIYDLGHVVGISLVVSTAMISLVYAFSISTLSVPVVIAGTSPLISSLLARVFFKERLSVYQYFGGILTVTGVMLLSLM